MKTDFIYKKYYSLRVRILYLALFISSLSYSQDFRIIKTITSQYPIIKATFLATNSIGEKISNAQPSDFTIAENKANCTVIEVTNPRETAVPASIVLVFDVSISMGGERLTLAKKAAKGFIEQMPLESSEVAIASFSDDVYVNCDFTQNQERLFEAIDDLRSIGGTNYTKAFLNGTSGAISIATNGRHKKNIIFLTDGLSNTDVAEVVSKAKKENITVYCITLELPIPDILRDISTQTGGKYFEAVANSNQLDGIYSSIFQTLEVTKYGTITWKAGHDCRNERNVHFVFRNKPFDFTYHIPPNKIGTLDIDPSLLAFGSAPIGANKNLSIDLIARNIPLNITRISIAGKGPFSLADSTRLPLLLTPDHVKNITLTYRPKDAQMVSDKLLVSTRECPVKGISLFGGSDEQLRLICPKGGEKLVVSIDTSVQWEGVKKEKAISIFYRAHPDKDWKPIGSGSGLRFPWITPNDTSKQVQVKLVPSTDQTGSLFLAATMPSQKPGLRGAFFSSDGTKAISTDRIGTIKIWDTETGRVLSTIDGFRSNTAIFSNNDKYIISFTKDESLVLDAQTSKLIARQPIGNKIIFTSQILPDGTEKLMICNLSKDMANTYKLWMQSINRSALIFEKDYVQSAALTPDGSKALTLSSENVLKIWDIHKGTSVITKCQPISPISIIINPNGKTALIIGPGTLTMIDMKNGNELFHVQRFTYKRFSDSGDMTIARSYDNNTVFIDSYTGKQLAAANNAFFYKCFKKGYGLLFYKNDSITIIDALLHRKLFQQYKPAVIDAIISQDDSKVMTITQSNVIDLYSINNKAKPYRIGEIDGDIRTALFSPTGKSMLVLMNDNSMQYWTPQGTNQSREVLSGYFTILSPKPIVKKIIRFDDQFIKQSKEVLIKDFITNPTHYPIRINKIELVTKNATGFDIVSDPYPAHLEPKSQKAGEFRFTPSRIGKHQEWVRTCTLTDTFLTELTGNGITKKFEISSTDINFGRISILEHRDTLAAIIQNNGQTPLTIKDILNGGPNKNQFSILSAKKNYILQPNSALTVKLRFSPNHRGKISGSLQIKIQGLTDNQIVNLIGEGLASKEIWICGKTLNSEDSLPLSANVRCNDLESDNLISKLKTDKTGNFSFKINADRNYGLIAEKSGYLSTSENIDIREATLTDTIRRNIFLTELKGGSSIKMNCIFFEFAKSNLLESSKNELNRIVDLLNLNKTMTVELQGHTDSIGSDPSNMLLSTARVNAVRNYLVLQGIVSSRLSTKAFGETRPVAPNSTAEGRQLNRRVELKIIKF